MLVGRVEVERGELGAGAGSPGGVLTGPARVEVGDRVALTRRLGDAGLAELACDLEARMPLTAYLYGIRE